MELHTQNDSERSKVKVKVTKKVKNTVMTITVEPDMLETSGLVQNVHITFPHAMHMVRSLRVRITFALRTSE